MQHQGTAMVSLQMRWSGQLVDESSGQTEETTRQPVKTNCSTVPGRNAVIEMVGTGGSRPLDLCDRTCTPEKGSAHAT